MKLLLTVTSIVIATTSVIVDAAPAIVWTKNTPSSSSTVHTSKEVSITWIISEAIAANANGQPEELNNSQEESSTSSPLLLDAVIFLVGREGNGGEGLSHLASSGALPTVSQRYGSANAIHYNVGGVLSSHIVTRAAATAAASSNGDVAAAEASLQDFNRKLTSTLGTTANTLTTSKQGKAMNKRTRDIANARILVVNAPVTNGAELDAAITKALDSKSIGSVIVSSIRSTDEVKHERLLIAHQRQLQIKSASEEQSNRRRLAGDDANNANNNNNANFQGIYYVAITPNILSGVLFMFFFIFVTYVGLMCMGMIQGQDVYTDKYPVIGREA